MSENEPSGIADLINSSEGELKVMNDHIDWILQLLNHSDTANTGHELATLLFQATNYQEFLELGAEEGWSEDDDSERLSVAEGLTILTEILQGYC